MTERERRHEEALDEQDRLFEYYAHLRQKIYAALSVAGLLIVWDWLMSYDPVHVWYGVLVVPLVLLGTWLMVTPKNYIWQSYFEE